MAIWFESPAARFEEALPIGAGRFGAMVYGVPEKELLQLNEDSVWSGGPRSRVNPDAKTALPEIRRLIAEGKISAAEKLVFQKMQGCPPNCRHYMPLGDLTAAFTLPAGEISDYRRSLDLETGICTVSFRCGGVQVKREVFASFPAQVIVLRQTADAPFSAEITMDGRDDYYDENNIYYDNNGAFLRFSGGSGTADGIRFSCCTRARCTDGAVTAFGNTLAVQDTHEMLLIFAVRTSYYHPGAELSALAVQDADRALDQSWKTLAASHLADFRTLYDRTDISLPDAALADSLPTDRLLKAAQDGDTHACNALLTLYFRFGRYLMIAGSRPGTLPLNLQGIWNKDMWPAWGSRFTININTEMNYWGAESCNLPECHLPLFDLLRKMHANGTKTAQEMYGCKGWCCHHNTDLWGDTAPQDLWMPATIWPMGGAWLSLHIMEHFRYTGDQAFLAACYPMLHDAALFFTDYLTENAQGQLITSPSVSPENTYQLENGEKGSLCAGPSMDTQIITELYQDVMQAAEILGRDDAILPTLRAQLEKLPKPQIGKYGQIMEWAVDYDEVEPGHRHISQLFALHPAHQISPHKTPELSEAAASTLHRRLTHGGGHTGWSCAWIANMYARLCDGDAVYDTLTKLMTHSTYPNLFDMHPPFQIDGNFGGSAAIAECLLQTDSDGIRILPACPAAWNKGSFRGLRAYGGFAVSAAWVNGSANEITIHSDLGGACRLFLQGIWTITDQNDYEITSRKEADGCMEFMTVSGGVYHLTRA